MAIPLHVLVEEANDALLEGDRWLRADAVVREGDAARYCGRGGRVHGVVHVVAFDPVSQCRVGFEQCGGRVCVRPAELLPVSLSTCANKHFAKLPPH